MEIICIQTGSKGNCYALRADDGETLLIEAGTPIKNVIQALRGARGIVGCLISHEHGDHALYARQFVGRMIRLYCSQGTRNKLKGISTRDIEDQNKIRAIESRTIQDIGSFKVMPFNVLHDAEEPYGFLIYHREVGTILFATDTMDLPQTFEGVDHWLVECNYQGETIEQNYRDGVIDLHRLQRTKDSHMALETLEAIIARHAEFNRIKSIFLIHLSDTNSDEEHMIGVIGRAGKCPTYAMRNGDIMIPLK